MIDNFNIRKLFYTLCLCQTEITQITIGQKMGEILHGARLQFHIILFFSRDFTKFVSRSQKIWQNLSCSRGIHVFIFYRGVAVTTCRGAWSSCRDHHLLLFRGRRQHKHPAGVGGGWRSCVLGLLVGNHQHPLLLHLIVVDLLLVQAVSGKKKMF